jgi:hypothetical protein
LRGRRRGLPLPPGILAAVAAAVSHGHTHRNPCLHKLQMGYLGKLGFFRKLDGL